MKEYSKLSKNALICMFVASGILDIIVAAIVALVKENGGIQFILDIIRKRIKGRYHEMLHLRKTNYRR